MVQTGLPQYWDWDEPPRRKTASPGSWLKLHRSPQEKHLESESRKDQMTQQIQLQLSLAEVNQILRGFNHRRLRSVAVRSLLTQCRVIELDMEE